MSIAPISYVNNDCKIFVGDLHENVSNQFLYEKFCEIGPIKYVYIFQTKNAEGFISAVVCFDSATYAQMALETMNGDLMCGFPIRIMMYKPNDNRRNSSSGNVFIKNIDKTVQAKSLYKKYEIFGKILSCKIAVDKDGITESSQEAIEQTNNQLFQSKVLYVAQFQNKLQRPMPNIKTPESGNLYVKNIALSINDEQFTALFANFGTIISVKLMRKTKHDQKHQGFGFVCFADKTHAENAIAKMKNCYVAKNKLYVNFAQTKEVRKMKIAAKYNAKVKQQHLAEIQHRSSCNSQQYLMSRLNASTVCCAPPMNANFPMNMHFGQVSQQLGQGIPASFHMNQPSYIGAQSCGQCSLQSQINGGLVTPVAACCSQQLLNEPVGVYSNQQIFAATCNEAGLSAGIAQFLPLQQQMQQMQQTSLQTSQVAQSPIADVSIDNQKIASEQETHSTSIDVINNE